MDEIALNTVTSLQKELAEALASYKREHMAHSVTLSQLEATQDKLRDALYNAVWWQNQFNCEQVARFELLKIIRPV